MLQLMAWDQIYQITHILSKIAVVIMYIYINSEEHDDRTEIVMRNKAIQVDTNPAGRVEYTEVVISYFYLQEVETGLRVDLLM